MPKKEGKTMPAKKLESGKARPTLHATISPLSDRILTAIAEKFEINQGRVVDYICQLIYEDRLAAGCNLLSGMESIDKPTTKQGRASQAPGKKESCSTLLE